MSTKETLLIVEDDKGLQSQLRWHFDDYNVIVAGDRKAAIDAIRLYEPKVVLQDLGLPPDDEGVDEGFNCVRDIIKLAPTTKIIVMTGNADYENAVHAVALGAYDFYQKPVNTETLDLIVQRALQMFDLETQNRKIHTLKNNTLEGVLTADPGMIKVCRTLEKIANNNVSCTLLGETGTGKEVLSQALHAISDRRDERFVAINCASIPENLMESELFGYEKGAFTGAHKRTLGKIELAHKGTLFLDEIGDMPFNLQAKMLRFLQERIIERVGGREEISVDVRVICATHKDLQDMVKNNEFREDLYYRLCEIDILIPPLRDREGDKILLARHFLRQFADQHNQKINGFTPDATQAIEHYHWPGNIRELKNKIKRAVIMSEGKLITLDDVGLDEVSSDDGLCLNLRTVRQNAEKNAIIKALAISNNIISNTAKLLGVTRPTLYDLIKKYDIAVDLGIKKSD